MRKSQAPSLKAKLPQITTINEEKSSTKPTSCSDTTFKTVRSTESILDLLSTSNNCFSVEKVDNLIETSGDLVDNKIKSSNLDLEPSVTVYNVVYGKQTKKKHKTWEGDGILEIGSKYLTLKDEEGKIIGTGPYPKSRKLEEGERLYIGSKEVELLDVANNQTKAATCKTVEQSQKQEINKRRLGFSKKFLPPKLNQSCGVALPDPNTQHQWNYNKDNLPITPVHIEGSLAKKLREHQIAGVTFLYECIMGFKDCELNGAILADEMGLGKTLQCIALIWTLLKQGPYGNLPVVKKVLIVTPSSLTMNWFNEFNKWLGRVKLVPFCVNLKNKPSKMTGPVMIISYEMLIRYFEEVEKHSFDLLICDEGHRLKNANIKTTQTLQRLNCPKRILLTGTPIQNDLQEFYCLVDFVNPNILGTPAEFRKRFLEPILASRQPNADEEVLAEGKECSQELKRITSKFLLRRTRDILSNYLPLRHETVVFCRASEAQKQLYNSIIDSFVGGKENFLGGQEAFAPLELIISLRKVCSHPCLLERDSIEREKVPPIELSTKLSVLVNFLKELRENSPKEKVVLVSNSTQTLDLLETVLDSVGYLHCRLDGSTPTAQRNEIVDRFNHSYCKSFVFLLSAKAGGVGLNLTGASRLVLFDSDWNPATDLQAIARIWRDGQKFPVFIYRLLTAGTIEEKIYQRQISKQGLCEGTIDPETAKSIKLSREELKDLFSYCSLKEDCLTHNILACDCSKQGEIPVPEIEPEERSCQLMKESSTCARISELFHWEHHGPPFNSEFLFELCLEKSQNDITFIFRSCKN